MIEEQPQSNEVTLYIKEGRTVFYTGIGSRKTPPSILSLMSQLANRLEQLGFILRSGAAEGADSAFERGTHHKEIYLPCTGFRSSLSTFTHPTEEAIRIAELIYPFPLTKKYLRALMGRNTHQILGYDLKNPSDFVICWTVDGAETTRQRSWKTGGTGQAIDLADRCGIPVFNLANEDALTRLGSYVKSHPHYQNLGENK